MMMKNVIVSWKDLLLYLVVLVNPQRRVQLQAPKLLIVVVPVNCICRCAIQKNPSFVKRK